MARRAWTISMVRSGEVHHFSESGPRRAIHRAARCRSAGGRTGSTCSAPANPHMASAPPREAGQLLVVYQAASRGDGGARDALRHEAVVRQVAVAPFSRERDRVAVTDERAPPGAVPPGRYSAAVRNVEQQGAAVPEQPCEEIERLAKRRQMLHHVIRIDEIEALRRLSFEGGELVVDRHAELLAAEPRAIAGPFETDRIVPSSVPLHERITPGAAEVEHASCGNHRPREHDAVGSIEGRVPELPIGQLA